MKAELTDARVKDAEWFAFVQQSLILVLASMILDGGGLFQVCFYAFTAYWAGVGLLRLRAGAALSKVDLLLIRSGYLPACVLSFFLTYSIWHLRGYDLL
jgi:hypothetical protein